MARRAKRVAGAGRGIFSLVRNRQRDFVAAGVFVVGLAVPTPIPFDVRILIAFDAAALAFLGLAWSAMVRANTASMPGHARRHDEGKWIALAIGVVIGSAMTVAVAAELQGAKEGPSAARVALAAATILLSWAFTNTLFALHYAHAYYGEAKHSAQGLEFPGTPDPGYWDFVYFAFVVGTTFQTSDVAVKSSHIRRTVAVQGALAYFFTVVVLAISVNVLASLG
jgi:uncharacterized membrane protein